MAFATPSVALPPYEETWPPNYINVFAWRQQALLRLHENPTLLPSMLAFYAQHPVEWICHWCTTYDPRNAAGSKLTTMPFILFERQGQFIEFLWDCLQHQNSGLMEKSRDQGATWLAVCFSVWLWRFLPGASIGWGSRKQELVDRIGDPDSIFEKLRMSIRWLPPVFWPDGFEPKEHMSFMRVVNPESGATITGEVGDNIGRGGRKLIYFKDEAAHYEHPELIEAALSENTRVQIDISSVNGLGNVFHRRREGGVEWHPGAELENGRIWVFVFDWTAHPEKTQDWYETKRRRAEDEGLQHVFAQEVDRDYAGAVEGIIIPAPWVRAAIDAQEKLGFDEDGGYCAALDVADEGGDLNALAVRKGVVLHSLHEWGERDTGMTTRRCVHYLRELNQLDLQYDSVGIGAGVKAEANRLRDEDLLPKHIRFIPWNAGGQVIDPDGHVIPGDKKSPTNREQFANMKAQGWWELRRRFERTFKAVTDPTYVGWKPEQLISIPGTLPMLYKLQKELSQPTMSLSASTMKLVIDKKPDGSRSPNLADAVMMLFWPAQQSRIMKITAKVLERAHISTRRRY